MTRSEQPDQMDLTMYAVDQNKTKSRPDKRIGKPLINPCEHGDIVVVEFDASLRPFVGGVPIRVRRSFTQRPIDKAIISKRVSELSAGSTAGRRVDVVRRDGWYNIVDGQHLYIAHNRLKLPVEVQLWESKTGGEVTADEERLLNTVLNIVRAHSPLHVYKNHVGPTKDFFDRYIAESKSWNGRILLSASARDAGKVTIASMVTITSVFAVGGNAGMQQMLERMDAHLAAPGSAFELQKFLDLAGDIFSAQKLRTLKARGVAPSRALQSWARFCRDIGNRPNGRVTNRARKMVEGWNSNPIDLLRQVQ